MAEKNKENYEAEIGSILKKIDEAPHKETALVARSSELPARATQYYNPYELVDRYSVPLSRAIETYFAQVVSDTPENRGKCLTEAKTAIREEFEHQARVLGEREAKSIVAEMASLFVIVLNFVCMNSPVIACVGVGALMMSYLSYKKAGKDSKEVEKMFQLKKIALANGMDPKTIKGNKAVYKRSERNIRKIIVGKNKMPDPFTPR
ncbi:MAG: hypothetical protein PHE27_05950 [Alphaproteobacteria bacterium]|nr:hypothetical protein [Alphaproteobacteria bacterium]